jgi:rod shape-determining protein MreC
VIDRKVIRRRRAVLALLVALSIGLLTVYFREAVGGTLHVFQRGAQEALSPVQAGASRAFQPVRNASGWAHDTLAAKGENDRLRREVSRLRRELASAQTDSRDVAQLRGLESLASRATFPGGLESVTARVISRSPTQWYAAVGIDKGREDGLRVDQPVIGPEGLVGKVTQLTGDTARVTLLTDQTSAVSAQVLPQGATGVVKPDDGQPDDLLLDFVERGRRLKEGQTVVTSGSRSAELESLFPRGIPVGKVTKVDPNELELYQRVHIEPFADLRRFDIVQVLIPGGAEERAAAP